MDKEKYSIIFSSLTGNTKKLADTIRAVLPAEDCDYFGAPKAEELHSEILYIGFWTDKGNADSATLELLSKLRDKKVFLFGTAGFGGSEAYFQKILEHVKQSVGPSNSVFGEYMCQGKMPQSVRDRYMKMKTQPEHPAQFVKKLHHQAAQQPSAASKIQKYPPKACKQRRFHAQFASFFRFMAANLSLTHCVTRARPLMWV